MLDNNIIILELVKCKKKETRQNVTIISQRHYIALSICSFCVQAQKEQSSLNTI